ncbi:heterokaryon incompatibility protein-domain-containing protein, partial [Lophiotrema nucula]
MRLIEIFDGSDNLRLCGPFLDANTPEYAILSHTWGTTEAEMTFQEMERMDNRSQKPGWEKIKAFCREARKNGFKYAWVDTVCIDKTSSAELSEAINSMYKWYSKAKVCYAFLEDWSSERRWELKHCRWFTRGWTLQELIAPPNVHFYMNNWQYAGSLETLHKEITNITGIDTFTLGGNPVKRLSVARRMSWASKRVTTREEDEAYCLLGIFGVNLPLLYGEGKRAFIRLQEEILRNLDDQTIFAWNVQSEHNLQASAFWSLLAPSPAFFSHAAEYIPIRGAPQLGEYSVTNSGVLLQAPLVEG